MEHHSILIKVCNSCQQPKSVDEYYAEKRGTYGVRAQCKCCYNSDRRSRWPLRTEAEKQKERLRLQLYRLENAETVRKNHREWSCANRDKISAYGAKYRAANSSKINDRISAWSKANPDKCVARSRRYQQRHPEKAVAAVMKREALKRQAYAPWDKELTDFVANEAAHLCRLRLAATGFKWHVDHIIPLAGESVCGLHVWNNLQVIPAVLNIKKQNKMIEVNWK